MRIISLNIWGGTRFASLMEFIKKESADTDVFCFQEVFHGAKDIISNDMHMDIFDDLKEVLPDFERYFLPIFEMHDFAKKVDFMVQEGTAIFFRKSVSQGGYGSRFVLRSYNDHLVYQGNIDFPSALQYLEIDQGGRKVLIAHIHGTAQPGTKLDTPERLEQSRNIIKCLDEKSGEKILCGDFNLMPDTESIRIIEQFGLHNLIKDSHIGSTRSKSNLLKWSGNEQFFADYLFVSPNIIVKSFTVPDLEVSDHLPLILHKARNILHSVRP